MTTQQFIEDAIAGGWKSHLFKKQKAPITAEAGKEFGTYLVGGVAFFDVPYKIRLASTLLDPLAWQAVGKARADYWEATDTAGDRNTPQYSNCVPYGWPWRWHRFIDHLADGLTIEEALGKIG